MKTIYFPYTSIDPRQAEKMAAVWGPLTLLQPSVETCLPGTRRLQEAGCIEPLFPFRDHSESLIDALNAFEQWAAQNTGSDLAAMMEQGQTIPFFSSQSSTQIVAEIRKQGDAPGEAAPARDEHQKTFQDRLLLAMAQKFDCQQEELGRAIETLAHKERQMMALLKGEDVIETGPLTASWVSAAMRRDAMIDLRLKAWVRVMAALDGLGEGFPGAETEILFLTDSRGAMAQIRERFPEAQHRLQAYHLASGNLPPEVAETLPHWLAKPLILKTVDEDRAVLPVSAWFDLFEIPRLPIELFFQRLSNDRHRQAPDPTARAFPESCWIGYMPRPEDPVEAPD